MAGLLESDSDSEEFEGFVVSPEEKSSYQAWTRKRRASEALDTSSDTDEDNNDDDDDDDDESDSDDGEQENSIKNYEDEALLYDEVDDINMDDSTDSETSTQPVDQCPVCLMSLKGQMLGTPNNCSHVFCLECIQEWGKNATTCPVGRKAFNEIFVHATKKGPILQRIPVEEKQAEIDEEEDDPTYCEVCNRCDREDRLLLCDGCDNGYHMECLSPPVEFVPIEEWYCPLCMAHGTEHEEHIQEFAREIALAPPTRGRPRGSTMRPSRVLVGTGSTRRARTVASTRGRGRAGRGPRRNAGGPLGRGRARSRRGTRSSTRGGARSASSGRKMRRKGKKRSQSRKKKSRSGGKRSRKSSKKTASTSTRKRRKPEEDESPFIYEPKRRGKTVHARLKESLKSAGPSTEPGPSASLGRVPFPSRLEPSSSFTLFGNSYQLYDFEEQEEAIRQEVDHQTEDRNSAWSSEEANPDVLGSIFQGLDTLHSSNPKISRNGRIMTDGTSRESGTSTFAKSKNDTSCKSKTKPGKEKQYNIEPNKEHGARESNSAKESDTLMLSQFVLSANTEGKGGLLASRKNIVEAMESEENSEERGTSRGHSSDVLLLNNSSRLKNECLYRLLKQDSIRGSERSSSADTREVASLSSSFPAADKGSPSAPPTSQLSNFRIPKRSLSSESLGKSAPRFVISERTSASTAFSTGYKIPKRTHAPSVDVKAHGSSLSTLEGNRSNGALCGTELQPSTTNCVDLKGTNNRMFFGKSVQPLSENSGSSAGTKTVIKQEPLSPRTICSTMGTPSSSNATTCHASKSHGTQVRDVTFIKQEPLQHDSSFDSRSMARAAAPKLTTGGNSKLSLKKEFDSHENATSGTIKIKKENVSQGDCVTKFSTMNSVITSHAIGYDHMTGDYVKTSKVTGGHVAPSSGLKVIKKENDCKSVLSDRKTPSKALLSHLEVSLSSASGSCMTTCGSHAASSSRVAPTANVFPPVSQLKLFKGKDQRLEIIEMLREKKRNMATLMSREGNGSASRTSSHDSDKLPTSCCPVSLPVAIVKPSPHVQPSGTSTLPATGLPARPPAKSIASGILDVHSLNARDFNRGQFGGEQRAASVVPRVGDQKIKQEVKTEQQENVKQTSEKEDNRNQRRKLGIARLQRSAQIVDEVKLALKPYFVYGEITKDEYKRIMKKSVEKIKESQSSIDRDRVGRLVKKYIKKTKGQQATFVSPS